MGRVAAAGDNAAMESFHSLLQKNVLNRRRWRTRAELRYEIITWIEHTYNRRRRQRALGKLTPVEFELAFSPPTLPIDSSMISHNHRQPNSRQTRTTIANDRPVGRSWVSHRRRAHGSPLDSPERSQCFERCWHPHWLPRT